MIQSLILHGRSADSQWVTSFTLSHSYDGVQWTNVTDNDGRIKVFDGNVAVTAITLVFDPDVIITRHLELQPRSWHTYISFEWELLGCAYSKSDILSSRKCVKVFVLVYS